MEEKNQIDSETTATEELALFMLSTMEKNIKNKLELLDNYRIELPGQEYYKLLCNEERIAEEILTKALADKDTADAYNMYRKLSIEYLIRSRLSKDEVSIPSIEIPAPEPVYEKKFQIWEIDKEDKSTQKNFHLQIGAAGNKTEIGKKSSSKIYSDETTESKIFDFEFSKEYYLKNIKIYDIQGNNVYYNLPSENKNNILSFKFSNSGGNQEDEIYKRLRNSPKVRFWDPRFPFVPKTHRILCIFEEIGAIVVLDWEDKVYLQIEKEKNSEKSHLVKLLDQVEIIKKCGNNRLVLKKKHEIFCVGDLGKMVDDIKEGIKEKNLNSEKDGYLIHNKGENIKVVNLGSMYLRNFECVLDFSLQTNT